MIARRKSKLLKESVSSDDQKMHLNFPTNESYYD